MTSAVAVPESVTISAVPEQVQVARTFLAGVLGKSHAHVDLTCTSQVPAVDLAVTGRGQPGGCRVRLTAA